MSKKNLKGIISAIMVSFHEDGSVNEKGLREIVRHNIDKMKVDGLYVCGSTGENFLISEEEKKNIFKIVQEETNSQVALIAQVGSLNIYESKRLAAYVTDLGYDAISAVTPFYYKFSFSEIKSYYEDILSACDNDLIIYSIPFLTGVNMTIEQFEELFQNDRIIGVKFTANDFYFLERIRTQFKNKIIYSGFDEMFLPALTLGVDGAIGSTFNVNGPRAKQTSESFKSGNLEKAKELQSLTNDFITELLQNGLYPTLKEILKTQNVDAGYCRRPMHSATKEQAEKAKEIYKKYLQQF